MTMARRSGFGLAVVAAVVGLGAFRPPCASAAVVICQKGKKLTLRADQCKAKETRVALGTDALPPATQLLGALGSIDAGTLDGKDSTAFLGVNDKAADADKLDGKDSTEFGPVAYAHVGSDGTLDATNSKNITATSLFTIPMTFYYCIDVAVPFKNIMITPDTIAPRIMTATVGDPYTSCAPYSPTQAHGDITVQPFDAGGANVASGFWILLN